MFNFYNGVLYRLVITYDRDRTDGLRTEDMIEAISATYGPDIDPAAAEIVFPSVFNETVKVLARWDDAQSSLNLVRSSYKPAFGVVLYSKRLDALAQAAIAEAVRIELREAPQKEAERLRLQEEAARVRQEKARLANKGSFTP